MGLLDSIRNMLSGASDTFQQNVGQPLEQGFSRYIMPPARSFQSKLNTLEDSVRKNQQTKAPSLTLSGQSVINYIQKPFKDLQAINQAGLERQRTSTYTPSGKTSFTPVNLTAEQFFNAVPYAGAMKNVGISAAKNVMPSVVSKATSAVPSLQKEFESFAGRANPSEISRGFTESVQNAPNILDTTKKLVTSTYAPKANKQLLSEVKGLLSEGVKINLKGVNDVDRKVAAVMQEAINAQGQGNHQLAANLFNNLAEHGTELGRGVQAFSLLPKMSPEAITLSLAGKINKFNQTSKKKLPQLTQEQTQYIAGAVDRIKSLPAGREKNLAINEMNTKLNEVFPSTIVDKGIALWKAGLLTSLRTQERNVVGNAMMLGTEVMKNPIAAGADMLMSGSTGKRTISPSIRGLGEVFSKKTGTEMVDQFKTGFDATNAMEGFDLNKSITWDKTPVQQALKKYTDMVFRSLGASDKPFYNASFANSLANQAKALAINAGRQGDNNFITSIIKSPTDDMLKIATQDAQYSTFKDKNVLSDLASGVKRKLAGMEGWKGEAGKVIGEVTMPFTGVPSSIVEKTIAYSPLGLIKGAYNVGKVMIGDVPELQRQAAQEVARGIVGTGLYGLGGFLMQNGLMTGQPKDAEEANLWQVQGKQANSVLIGGKWRSINSVGPQTLALLAGAKANEFKNNPEMSSSEYGASLLKDQLDQTFLKGVSAPLNAITDPKRFGEQFVGGLASSVVPNIVKDTAKALDPLQRENNSITDYVKNSIPVLRNKSLPKRDVLGNEIGQEPTGFSAFFDLFNSKTPIKNEVTSELERLATVGESATPNKLGAKFSLYGQKINMSPKELDELEKQTNGVLSSKLESIVTSDAYKGLEDMQKSKILSDAITAVRSQAKKGVVTGDGFGGFSAGNLNNKQSIDMARTAFENSDKKFQVFGDKVFRKSADGTVSTISKTAYEEQLLTAKMTNALTYKDKKSWLKLAQDKFNALDKQLKDPSTDELEKVRIQNEMNSITKKSIAVLKGGKRKKLPKLPPVKIALSDSVTAKKTDITGGKRKRKELTLKDLLGKK